MTTHSPGQTVENKNQSTEVDNLDQPLAWWIMLLLPIYATVVMAIFVFPFAGNLRWLYGWIFVGSLALNLTINAINTNLKNPRVLRNRTRFKKQGVTEDTKESASTDRFIIPLMSLGYYGAIILPALGYRFGWYALPLWAALAGVVVMNLGVIFLNIATLQNAFASKILDISKDQVLIDTGLYGRIRHPVYAGGIIMMVGTPIALGSLWGLIPALFAALMIVIRIRFEEDMLLAGMEGYADYRERVPYKLIPGVY